MHLKRWLTSLVALPLLVLMVLKGGHTLFSVFIGIVALLGLWEYTRIVDSGKGDDPSAKLISGTGLVAGASVIWAASASRMDLVPIILSFTVLLIGFLSLKLFQDDPDISRKAALQSMGTIYIPMALSYFVLIRQTPDGANWVLFIACTIFAGDTAAYYAGTYFGRHKLCPSVSPGKTIEGAGGGLVANLCMGVLFWSFVMPALPLGNLLLFCTAIGLAGQVGDLFESVLKRSAGVKDSGGMLPGHGGILDRIDALLFALPVAYFFKISLFAQQVVR